MTAAICVPWRGGSPSREKVWDVSRAHYAKMQWPVVTGDSDPALPFNRPAARNAAARAAGDVDAYIFMDADTMIDEHQLAAAVRLVTEFNCAALPYTQYFELNTVTGEARERVNTSPGRHLTSGNIVVSRYLWEVLGGWDERLAEYGWEDGAFIYACDVMGGVLDIPGPMMSFDHARNPDELPERLSMDNVPPIFKEYQQARSREAMEELLERARVVQSGYQPPRLSSLSIR